MKTKTISYAFLLMLLLTSTSISYASLLPENTKVDKIMVFKSQEKIIKTYKIALGKNPVGHKQYEGDNKTPEGTYHINDKNPFSQFHKNLANENDGEQENKGTGENLGENLA